MFFCKRANILCISIILDIILAILIKFLYQSSSFFFRNPVKDFTATSDANEAKLVNISRFWITPSSRCFQFFIGFSILIKFLHDSTGLFRNALTIHTIHWSLSGKSLQISRTLQSILVFSMLRSEWSRFSLSSLVHSVFLPRSLELFLVLQLWSVSPSPFQLSDKI